MAKLTERSKDDVALRPFNVLSLCSGVGGLDLGLRMAVPQARTVCFVEREAYCCEVLAKRMEDGYLDEAPIWTDLRTFAGGPWGGVVDCVIAGFPCQPFSKAGRRLASLDERHLWPHVARVVREVYPTWCLFENVPNFAHLGFAQAHDDLAAMGFRVAADFFRTSEVGGPTQNERFFFVATSQRQGVEGRLPGTNPSGTGPWGWRGEEDLRAIANAPFEQRGGRPQPLLRRVDDGLADRMDRLRACGNGVVPQVACLAFLTLSKALGTD